MTIDSFLTREREHLLALMAAFKDTYGRLPAEFVVGPPVDAFDAGVKFFEIPVRWEPECAGGQVLALTDTNASLFDRKAAQSLRKSQREEAIRRAMSGDGVGRGPH